MSEGSVQLGVRAGSRAEESQLLGDLQSFLLERTERLAIERVRTNNDSQDPGTALVVAILSASSIIELAKGVADWMRKRNVNVTISAEGGISVEGPPENVERIIRDILNRPSPSAR